MGVRRRRKPPTSGQSTVTSPPRADLDVRPVEGLVADSYRATERRTDAKALLFHSSNGSRQDLTQLAWSLASWGMDALTVTWISGPRRRAWPDAYDAVGRLLESVGGSGADEPRPPTVVTWSDASLVALTELNRRAAGLVPSIAVTLGGVFGWPAGVPPEVGRDPVAVEFFGGPAQPASTWIEATPHVTLGAQCGSTRLISIATEELVEGTVEYHRAARAVGMDTELFEWNGPAMEMVVPRQPAGRAVAQQILAASGVR